VTDLIAGRALELLFTCLPRCAEDPTDVDARARCQLGCWFSFFSPPSVMLGPSHSLGHQLGSRCDVPHGVTSCIFLPRVMRFLAPALAERMVPIAQAIGVDTTGKTPEESALAAADAVAAMVRRLGLPGRLRDVGATEADLEPIAEAAFAEGGTQGTARAIGSVEELMGILREAW
jgi:alcohol dehydrogenase class IV